MAFRSPTPTGVPITYRAWVTKREGRRITFAAEAHHGDTLTATAEALFVIVDEDRYVQHKG